MSRYLETRKGGPQGNTAKTHGRTLILSSGKQPAKLNPGNTKSKGGCLKAPDSQADETQLRLSRLMIAACLAYIWIIYLGVLAELEGWGKIIHLRLEAELR